MQKCGGGIHTRVQRDWRRGAQDRERVMDRVEDEASRIGMGEAVKSPVGYKYSIISIRKSC